MLSISKKHAGWVKELPRAYVGGMPTNGGMATNFYQIFIMLHLYTGDLTCIVLIVVLFLNLMSDV